MRYAGILLVGIEESETRSRTCSPLITSSLQEPGVIVRI